MIVDDLELTFDAPENPFERVGEVLASEELEEALDRLSYRWASKFAGRVRQKILGQEETTWHPLSKRWLDKKKAAGKDLRILRATGEYVQSIVPRRVGNGEYSVEPGDYPHKDDFYEGNETPLREIGLYLEYGTKTMHARPHFSPTATEFDTNRGEIISALEAELDEEIKSLLEFD